ncbi:MAG TPA: hypothetical protein VG826_11835 [Pirellulales bacterium]|nr:hypothetical protein [Pirellulales bacterium]
MSADSKELPLYRLRILTFIVLIVVAAPVVVANLSHDARPPIENGKGWPPPNASYGWPLVWYWCEFTPSSSSPRMVIQDRMTPELVDWSRRRLAVDVAVWLAMLAAVDVVCQWLLRRYAPPGRYRIRLPTLLALSVLATPIVLANLSRDIPRFWGPGPKYGWPWIWRWQDVQGWYGGSTELDQNYNTIWFAANLLVWVAMLSAAAFICEWLWRRFQPRFRWSLRTMLTMVTLVAATCGWCFALRERANLQDPIIAQADQHHDSPHLYLERWGPRWLDVVGADRFRRRIVGASVSCSDEDGTAFLGRLSSLPKMRYLDISVKHPIAGLAATLGSMGQVRILRIRDSGYHPNHAIPPGCIAAAGKLAQLEELHLEGVRLDDSLRHLTSLKGLRSLSMGFHWWDDEREASPPETTDGIGMLSHLPVLPRLELLELYAWDYMVDEEDVRHLAGFPRLQSINLTGIDVADAALAGLGSLKALEELTIDGEMTTPARLRMLIPIEKLNALHIKRYSRVTKQTLAALPLQRSLDPEEAHSEAEWSVLGALDSLKELRFHEQGAFDTADRLTTLSVDRGDRVFALESELTELSKALDALRKAHPRIVIDSDRKWFDRNRGVMRDDSVIYPVPEE